MTDAIINRLCIIGVGLIGGSLARALKAAGACQEVVGAGRDTAHLERAVALGVIDRYEADAAAAVKGADVVVVAVPVGAMGTVLRRIAPHLDAGTVLTDVGSTKASVVAEAEAAFGHLPANFVPGHPIAGTERSGVDASFAELFQGRRVILTPLAGTASDAVELVSRLWEIAGAEVTRMEVGRHDEVLAATSHLPHLLAFALVDTLARLEEHNEIFRYAAGGFRDFTRIASSDPQMWHDICLANRDAVLDVLARYQGDLERLADAIRNGDGKTLLDTFSRARTARNSFCEKND